MTAILIAACGSPPPPPAAPEPEPIEEEEVVVEPDPGVPSRVLIEARVREPFGVQSAGRIPSRAPRTGAVVLEGRTDPSRGTELTVVSAGPASDAEADPEREPETGTDDEEEDQEGNGAGETPTTGGTAPPATTARPTGSNPPAAAPANPPAPPRSASQRTHTVQSGETFYAIARRHSVTPMALAAANPGVDINLIRSGQVLRLPQTGNTPAAPARTHRVQAGETLWSISRRYGVSPAQIRQANRMTDDTVRAGEALVIP